MNLLQELLAINESADLLTTAHSLAKQKLQNVSEIETEYGHKKFYCDNETFDGFAVILDNPTTLRLVAKGYKTDVEGGEFDDAESVIEMLKSIDMDWMKENDPYGERW